MDNLTYHMFKYLSILFNKNKYNSFLLSSSTEYLTCSTVYLNCSSVYLT